MLPHSSSVFFFFNDTATTEIYTLSLHDALPISLEALEFLGQKNRFRIELYITSYASFQNASSRDRKSTRLNSSHQIISYAVFCLKKKKIKSQQTPRPALVQSTAQAVYDSTPVAL